ncbi:N-6 DNA methylase [Nocardioides hankookensis]|uniref:site-specific DNA-methyltransferase (adenine-specific) n=1 Tax=Nocardioides hankookensis TaxID=443157 RepID=A0ABW1LN34_9ACTN
MESGASAQLVLAARELGARGSRATVGSADPAAELTATAAAVLAAIPAWWAARAAEAGLEGRWLDVHSAVDTTPPLELAEEHPPLEPSWGPLSAEELGAAYVAALDPGVRARHGRHYTPGELARQLWEMARTALGHRHYGHALEGLVRDPACGAGALLLPPLREHLSASWEVDPQLVLAGLPALVEGIDADPAAVWVANIVLAAEMLPTLARVPESRRRKLPALARVGDGLAPADPAWAVLMNPPYGRVRLSDEDRERFADVLYGHANLYGIFMAAGQKSLAKRGVLAALVPTSFTAGRYFEPLRRTLTNRGRLQSIRFVEDRSGVFGSVLQETCLAIVTQSKVRKTLVTSAGSEVSEIAKVATPTGGSPWVLPRRADLAPVAAAAATMPMRLRELGWRVSTGPLVWNRRRSDLYAHAGRERYTVLWAADIDGGEVHRDQARATMRYLKLHDGTDRRVMSLSEPCVLVQRTTSPEQRRRLVGAVLTEDALINLGGRVVVENHVNVLRPTTAEPALSADLLGRLLATETMDQVTRCLSGSVALSAYELESLPFPPVEVLRSWDDLPAAELEVTVSAHYRQALMP